MKGACGFELACGFGLVERGRADCGFALRAWRLS